VNHRRRRNMTKRRRKRRRRALSPNRTRARYQERKNPKDRKKNQLPSQD
jgi:hypothetical protein